MQGTESKTSPSLGLLKFETFQLRPWGTIQDSGQGERRVWASKMKKTENTSENTWLSRFYARKERKIFSHLVGHRCKYSDWDLDAGNQAWSYGENKG